MQHQSPPSQAAEQRTWRQAWIARLRSEILPTVLELGIIVAWAIFFTRPYLQFDPNVVPAGREYLQHIHPHHLWRLVQQCGSCALWNGSVRGGYPAFVDPQTSAYHPLVMITTLISGATTGAKLTLSASFLLGGLAQWWLARVLRVGALARVWSGCMGVAAGHLAPRMENGLLSVVLSIVACMLVLPAFVCLSEAPRSSRRIVLLGVLLALAGIAGQGYMQINLALLLLVALLIQRLQGLPMRPLLAAYGKALVLAGLLAAFFLVPLFHFATQFEKNGDRGVDLIQPIGLLPLNFLINDFRFYSTEALQKQPYPWLYAYYVGWLTVGLALVGAWHGWRSKQRVVTLFSGLIIWSIWFASGIPLRWLGNLGGESRFSEILTGLRYPQMILALTTSLLIALSAWGLQRVVEIARQHWTIHVRLGTFWAGRLKLGSLLIVPLVLTLSSVYQLNRQWISTTTYEPSLNQVLDGLRTPSLEWVNTPFGDQFWIEPAINAGLKLATGTQGWYWKNRAAPDAVLEAHRGDSPEGMSVQREINDFRISAAEGGREYAAVVAPDGERVACTAQGVGGAIDVVCVTRQPGILTVRENNWSGWQASIDQTAAVLLPDRWLSLELPAGSHTIQLRYRPWDVWLGVALSGAGLGLAVWWLVRPGPKAVANSTPAARAAHRRRYPRPGQERLRRQRPRQPVSAPPAADPQPAVITAALADQ